MKRKSEIINLVLLLVIFLALFILGFWTQNSLNKINDQILILENKNYSINNIINNYTTNEIESSEKNLECLFVEWDSKDDKINFSSNPLNYSLDDIVVYGKDYLKQTSLSSTVFYQGIQCNSENGWILAGATVYQPTGWYDKEGNLIFTPDPFIEKNGAYLKRGGLRVSCCRLSKL